jgi:serine protease inhibitor
MSMFEGDTEGCEREETPWFVPRQASCVRAVIAHCTGRGEQNVVLSPSSLVTCMAMLYLGAGEGRPREQLRAFCWPDAAKNGGGDVLAEAEAVKAYADALAGLSPDVFCAANILVADGASRSEYVARVQALFGAEVLAPEAWEAANARVAAVLRDAEHADVPRALARKPDATVLMNASYFADQWASKFTDVFPGKFFGSFGRIPVQMMHQEQRLEHVERAGMMAVRLPYRTPGLGAWFVKSTVNAKSKGALALADLALETFLVGWPDLDPVEARIELTLPRFTMKFAVDLKAAFEGAGDVTDVFRAGGLTNMSSGPAFVGAFSQDCYLQVDELGTVAKALTKIATTRGGRSERAVDASFDQTFYMLVHYEETVLFAARVASPSASGE